MSENSVGQVLGAATVLPATSAIIYALVNRAHPLVLVGFLMLNIFALTVLVARLTRYFVNRK